METFFCNYKKNRISLFKNVHLHVYCCSHYILAINYSSDVLRNYFFQSENVFDLSDLPLNSVAFLLISMFVILTAFNTKLNTCAIA